jgi:hypothetical protein
LYLGRSHMRPPSTAPPPRRRLPLPPPDHGLHASIEGGDEDGDGEGTHPVARLGRPIDSTPTDLPCQRGWERRHAAAENPHKSSVRDHPGRSRRRGRGREGSGGQPTVPSPRRLSGASRRKRTPGPAWPRRRRGCSPCGPRRWRRCRAPARPRRNRRRRSSRRAPWEQGTPEAPEAPPILRDGGGGGAAGASLPGRRAETERWPCGRGSRAKQGPGVLRWAHQWVTKSYRVRANRWLLQL